MQIWCIIFVKLDTKTRLGCKQVCRYFYDVLAYDDIFKEDRCLFIHSCFLHEAHPVVLTLTNSNTKFEKLTIGDVEIDKRANLNAFWINIGLTVTNCKVLGSKVSLVLEIISKFFKVLQKLYVEKIHGFLRELTNGYEPTWLLSSVEWFKTEERYKWDIRMNGFQKFLNLMPNVQDVELPSDLILHGTEALKVLKTNAKAFKSLPYENSWEDLYDLTDLRHIRFESSNVKLTDIPE